MHVARTIDDAPPVAVGDDSLPGGPLAPPEDRLTPFEPMAVTAHYAAPTATINPNRNLGWMRRLLPLGRPQLLLVILAFSASAVSMYLQVQTPKVTGDAINSMSEALASGDSSSADLESYAIKLLVLGVFMGLSGFVFRFFLQRSAYQLEYVMRVLMFQKFGSMPFSYFDTVQTGQMVSRANSDIRTVQMFLTMAPMIGVTVVTFFFALYQMIQINIWLTIASFAVAPVVFILSSRMQKFMFPVSWLISSRMAEVATVVEENVAGAEVVRSFTAEKGQISLVDQAARKLQWASIRQSQLRAKLTPVVMNLPRAGMAIILFFGGWLAIEGKLSVGEIVEFNLYSMMVQMPFMMLGMVLMLAQRAAASSLRIFEVLDAVPDLVDKPGAVDLVTCEGDVEFRDVVFHYNTGDRVGPDVLDGASFHIRPGETVALVGRTGSGKSTVARLIPRFYDVAEGAVLVDGRDVRDLTAVSLRSHVGLVLDDSFLFSGTIRENIAFGRPDASQDDIEAVAEAAGATDFIEDLHDGYDTMVGERGSTLSGGQRQRIAIARTLLVNPRILILDDCTSAIDPHREHEIHGALRTLMTGRTTLVIAHRPATIALANRVLVLDGGRVVADGTHVDLMQTSELYREILSHAEELDADAAENLALAGEVDSVNAPAVSGIGPAQMRPPGGIGGGLTGGPGPLGL
jgi:ATP-binding cassette, subfamily B, bacterial